MDKQTTQAGVAIESTPLLECCPFCGGPAQIRQTSGMWWVTCEGYNCPCMPHTSRCYTAAQAAAAWNRRHSNAGLHRTSEAQHNQKG